MKRIVLPAVAAVLVGVAAVAAPSPAAPPTANAGLTPKVLSEIVLSEQFANVDTRRLRMRTLTLDKGGVIGLHNHENRPSVEYVLSGTVSEYRGTERRVLKPGDFISADKTTNHWWLNDGDGPLVLLAIDIYQP
jgi:quercetin dioxygenase-like cupin family protein